MYMLKCVVTAYEWIELTWDSFFFISFLILEISRSFDFNSSSCIYVRIERKKKICKNFITQELKNEKKWMNGWI